MTDIANNSTPKSEPVASNPKVPLRRGLRESAQAGSDCRAPSTPLPDLAALRPGSLAHRCDSVAKPIAGVRRIRLPEPSQIGTHAESDEVRVTGLHIHGMPMLGMKLFEVPGAGKTTTAKGYAKCMNRWAKEGTLRP